MERFLRERKLCLERLLTNENAREFWAWFRGAAPYPSDQILMLWASVSRVLERWHKPRMTQAEARADYGKIVKLAGELSAILERHSGTNDLSQCYRALVPTMHQERIQGVLHPALVEKFKSRGHAAAAVLDQCLPPLFVLLDRLASKTAELNPPTLPRKAKSQSALRIYMVDALFWSIGNRVKFSSAHWAQFLAVALDDVNITDATVRMIARSRNWWELANDSGET